MSTSVSFEFDPIDQPAATDPLERLTWCTLRIWVGQRIASRIWDKSLQSERTSLYVPAFPIATWIVDNWWVMLNELCPWETVPLSIAGQSQLKWIKRHCLRAADSSMQLPALYLYHDGQSLRAEWHSDPQGSVSNMLGEFIADGAEQLDADEVHQSLANFVNDTLARVADVDDDRVHQLQEQWRAVQSADRQEQEFCTIAGRMGIDPYDRSELTDELAEFLEKTLTNPSDPLVRDLTEVAQPNSVEQQWLWLAAVSEELKLGANAIPHSLTLPSRTLSPPQFGYKLAHEIRDVAELGQFSRLESVEQTASIVLEKPFRVHERNHIPGQGVRAIVGQSSDGNVISVGPAPARADNRRFWEARGLYHAIVTSQHGRRLVTNAYSWDQKASRAFAAELLAPQRALSAMVASPIADQEVIERLSGEFQASTFVIERQLENAGIQLSYE